MKMEKKEEKLISLIEDNNHEEFVKQVFQNRASDKSNGFYTISLSVDEEKALLHRIAADQQKDSHWYRILSDYMSHYPLSNNAIDFLLTSICNAMAVKIICIQFAKYGYTPEQGEKICRLINNDINNKVLIPLLPSLSKYSRFYDEKLYGMLWSIDERLREKNVEKTGYAESYKKNVYNYRKQNGLLNFHG